MRSRRVFYPCRCQLDPFVAYDGKKADFAKIGATAYAVAVIWGIHAHSIDVCRQ